MKRWATDLSRGLALLAIALLPLACGEDETTDPNPPPSAITISMRDDFFEPQTDTVAVGGTVTWTNEGQNLHSTTSNTALWDSDVNSGGQHAETFDAAGTYAYHCKFHVGMTGTIVVM